MLAIANVSRFIMAGSRPVAIAVAGFGCCLLQLILHFADARVDARLVDAGRAGETDPADHVVADLDRDAAADGDDMRQSGLLPAHRHGLHALDELLRGHAYGARGMGLAPRV